MQKHQAAELWASIEAALARRGLFIRDADRAELIRLVGRGRQPRKTRATSGDVVDAPAPPLGVIENTAHVPAQHVFQNRRGARHRAPIVQHDGSVKMRRIDDQHRYLNPERLEQIAKQTLDFWLDRACSRRAGYDGDDAVEY